MLAHDRAIPAEWRHRLDELLGTTDWHEHFYRVEQDSSLFGDPIERVTKASTDVIAQFFLTRLRERFAGVAANAMVLRNSKNSPLYLFCFAAGNPKGAKIALQIAEYILKMGG